MNVSGSLPALVQASESSGLEAPAPSTSGGAAGAGQVGFQLGLEFAALFSALVIPEGEGQAEPSNPCEPPPREPQPGRATADVAGALAAGATAAAMTSAVASAPPAQVPGAAGKVIPPLTDAAAHDRPPAVAPGRSLAGEAAAGSRLPSGGAPGPLPEAQPDAPAPSPGPERATSATEALGKRGDGAGDAGQGAAAAPHAAVPEVETETIEIAPPSRAAAAATATQTRPAREPGQAPAQQDAEQPASPATSAEPPPAHAAATALPAEPAAPGGAAAAPGVAPASGAPRRHTSPPDAGSGAPEYADPATSAPASAVAGREHADGAHQSGGREPGRRETDGGAVVVEAPPRGPGHGETPGARGAGGGTDPSASGPLPPTSTRGAGPAERPALREAPAPAPAGDVERLVRLDELRPLRVRDAGEMHIELSPEGLGHIEVRVAVRADAVHASLYANQDHARETLEAHRPSLEAALGRSNLRLEGFSVGLGQHQRGRDLSGDEAGARPLPPPAPVAAGLLAPIPDPARGGGGLSLRA